MLAHDADINRIKQDQIALTLAADCRLAFRSFNAARGFFGRKDPQYDRSFNAAVHSERLVRTSDALVAYLQQLVGYDFGEDKPTIALKSQTEATPDSDPERNYAAALRVLGCDFLVIKELAPSPVQLVTEPA